MQQPGFVEVRRDSVANAGVDARAEFLAKTYLHLAGAVVAWIAMLTGLFFMPGHEKLLVTMTSGYNWLIVLGGYLLVSYVAHRWAMNQTSVGIQYAGLALYTTAMSVITFPLVYVAAKSPVMPASVLPTAAILTLSIFAGLTAIVFITRKDFSFLRGALMLGSLVALGLIVASIVVGFSLGLVFTCAMIALMSGFILYETSSILHHFPVGSHVAASLALFSSLVVLFWYVLQLVMALSSND